MTQSKLTATAKQMAAPIEYERPTAWSCSISGTVRSWEPGYKPVEGFHLAYSRFVSKPNTQHFAYVFDALKLLGAIDDAMHKLHYDSILYQRRHFLDILVKHCESLYQPLIIAGTLRQKAARDATVSGARQPL